MACTWHFVQRSVQTYSLACFCFLPVYLCISSRLCSSSSDERWFCSDKLQVWFAAWIQWEHFVYYCGRWKEWKWAKFKLFAVASDQQILWREFACCEYLIPASLNHHVCWQCYCVNLRWLSRVSVLHYCQFLWRFFYRVWDFVLHFMCEENNLMLCSKHFLIFITHGLSFFKKQGGKKDYKWAAYFFLPPPL